jgi:hypothetical protein
MFSGWDRSCGFAAIVQASAVYPCTDSLGNEEPLVSARYNGTAQEFAIAVKTLVRNPNARALLGGVHLTVNRVLSVMVLNTAFLDLGLDTVDAVVLQRIGGHIVRIQRDGGARSCGRTLVVDVNDVRKRASEAECLRSRRATPADHATAFLCAAGVAIAGSLGVAALALMRRK